ncbi:MAG: lysyl-tRNA synthetase [Candidatus Berkelbacteria bacterium Gr01-1014_85]|uniref:Lysine--tRNA ligase n=1 Tax=Candidatus Berkelbacteria bacterium Gr01-1014_85 TaxID=2017150 RepID=A0A554J9P2_9BACT|nr:MAG: lysyl-tRNA synthetase [Candidatus Berkelbacteria bacterium Gr01-1014_85]
MSRLWTTPIVEQIIARNPDKSVYLIADYKTPSGPAHIGSLRGPVVHQAVTRALIRAGRSAHYLYGFDDFDPMDGFPSDLPDEWRQYMGQPLANIPSPDPQFDNLAAYYASSFLEVFTYLGLTPEIIYGSRWYREGRYDQSIERALNHSQTIRELYLSVSHSEKPTDWLPIHMLCPHCGKIGTTQATAWNGKEVTFVCRPDLVTWAIGCGQVSTQSPFGGQGKLPYKVEAAAKWSFLDEDFETAGKDHMTKGGSFDLAAAIAKAVYQIEPPIGRGFPCEFLLHQGKKMSSSKGLGHTAQQAKRDLPTELLIYKLGVSQPNLQVEFDLTGEAIPRWFDQLDGLLKQAFVDPDSEAAETVKIFYPGVKLVEYRMRFSQLAFLSQLPNVDLFEFAKLDKGSVLSVDETAALVERLEYAKYWLAHFADDRVRFILQTGPLSELSLDSAQLDFLRAVAKIYNSRSGWTGPELHTELHQLKAESGLEPRQAFGAIYQLFFAKESGPPAGWLIAALEPAYVATRLALVQA